MLVAVSGYVFVSYSRSDQAYVDQLVDYLESCGVETWIDNTGIDYGAEWPSVIRDAVDGCSCIIVVMTPLAESSQWVDRELHRAREQGKRIYPLLLEGASFFVLGVTQYEDISDEKMPSDEFVGSLCVELGIDPPRRETRSERPSQVESKRANRLREITMLIMTAESHTWKEEYEEAISAYARAATLDPTNPKVFVGLAQVLSDAKMKDEALAAVDRAINLEPGNVRSYVRRAWILADLGRLDESLAAADQAIEVDPLESSAYNARSTALAKKGDGPGALEALNQAKKLLGQEPWDISFD